MWNTNLLLCIFEIPPYYGWLAPELFFFLVRPSLCLSYLFQSCPFIPWLWRLCSSSFQAFLRRNHFLYSSSFVASVWGEEFRIFLGNHFPQDRYLRAICIYFFMSWPVLIICLFIYWIICIFIDLCELNICIWLALYLWYNLWIIPPVSCLSFYFVCSYTCGRSIYTQYMHTFKTFTFIIYLGDGFLDFES